MTASKYYARDDINRSSSKSFYFSNRNDAEKCARAIAIETGRSVIYSTDKHDGPAAIYERKNGKAIRIFDLTTCR